MKKKKNKPNRLIFLRQKKYFLLYFLTYVFHPGYKEVSIVFFSWNLANISETGCSFSVRDHQNYHNAMHEHCQAFGGSHKYC